MAVRRIARHGLQWAEQQAQHQPVASTSQLVLSSPSSARSCPGCRRGLAHAVPLPQGSAAPEDKGSAPAAAGRWASLSRASQALFPSSPSSSDAVSAAQTPDAANAPPQLADIAADLVQELQRKRPDPQRTWDLFTQLDLDGRTSSLPPVALAALLAAIHTPAPGTRTVQNVTSAARVYQTKVDLVRLRLAEADIPRNPRAEHAALLRQFHALRYAPGAVRAWDAAISEGELPAPADCRRAFEALAGWVELHGRAAGRAVERAVAGPLARKAASMLFEDIGAADARRVDAALEAFFRLAIKAGDLPLFSRAVKTLYGFDVALPGALLDVSAAERAGLRTIGEREVCWVLEALAEVDDLPGMIATFETFDHPERAPPSADADAGDFFTATRAADRRPAPPSTSEADAHLVGTRAFTVLIQAASRLGSASIARHYFDLLFMRWKGDAEARLADVELAVGITREKADAADEWVDDVPASSTASPLDAPSPVAVVSTDTAATPLPLSSSSIPPSVSLTSRYGAHLTPSPSQPAKPYVVPSTLIAHVAHDAKLAYDAPTAWWLRRRTKHILQCMEAHIRRIEAVLAALAEVDAGGAQSVAALRRELALVVYHRDQLRLTLDSVKADGRILAAWKVLHSRQTTLSFRARRIADPALGKRDLIRLRPGVRRKERQVLQARMLLVRNRIQKLREIDGLRTGHPEHDRWVAQYRALKALAFPAGPAALLEADAETTEAQAQT